MTIKKFINEDMYFEVKRLRRLCHIHLSNFHTKKLAELRPGYYITPKRPTIRMDGERTTEISKFFTVINHTKILF